MTPMGIKMLLYFMVVIMNAPLPIPSKTTASGNTQHREATNAEARLTIPDFTSNYAFMASPSLLCLIPKLFPFRLKAILKLFPGP